LVAFSGAPWDLMRSMVLIEFSTHLCRSRESPDLPSVPHAQDPPQSQRCSLQTTSSQLLIRLSMRLPSLDTDLEINSSVESSPLDPHMEQLAMELYTIPSHQRLTLLTHQDWWWPFPVHQCRPRVYYCHASDQMTHVCSLSQRFCIVSQRKTCPKKTT
jgi:hypothetical protein